MPKLLHSLSDDHLYGIEWDGQSNGRPRGDRDREGFVEAPHLQLSPSGLDLTVIACYGYNHVVGATFVMEVAEALEPNYWIGATVRFHTLHVGRTATFGVDGIRKGHATVVANDALTLVVRVDSTLDTEVTTVGYANSSGVGAYLVHEDLWYGYESVKVLTPYQPETPTAYPTGAPAVPGYDFASAGVESYEDCGLLLPLCWNEGLEGHGQTGTCTVSGLTATLSSGTLTDGMFVGAIAVVGGAWGRVASHDTAGFTVSSWTGTPGDGTLAFELSLPNWKDNPNRVLKGFRYPNVDMQPGGIGLGSLYNRPAGQLTPTYYVVNYDVAKVRTSINATGNAQSISRATSDFLAEYVDSTRIKISMWGNVLLQNNPAEASQRIQLDKLFAKGQLLNIFGWPVDTVNYPDELLNGYWIVDGVAPAQAAATVTFNGTTDRVSWTTHGLGAGEYIAFRTDGALPTGLVAEKSYQVFNPTLNDFQLLDPDTSALVDFTGAGSGTHSIYVRGGYVLLRTLDRAIPANPISLATSVAGTQITRSYRRINYRMGAMVECAWELAQRTGKTMHVLHLAVNSASQYLNPNNNEFTPPGRIGWFSDDYGMSWTPSAERGLWQRLKRLHTHVLPGALKVLGYSASAWKCLLGVTWQGETDATTTTGRRLYQHTLRAFHDAKRRLWESLGYSPYTQGAKVPIVHPQITVTPWELALFAGDTGRLVNTAIEEWAEADGFAATFNPDTLDTGAAIPTWSKQGFFGLDLAHFNGTYEAKNGLACAEQGATLVDLALSLGALDPFAIEVANLALTHIGESTTITAFDGSSQPAIDAAKFYKHARNAVLEARPWQFATRTTTPTATAATLSPWQFAYRLPVDAVTVQCVLPSGATPADTTQVQRFVKMADSDGRLTVLTNQVDAVIYYTTREIGLAPSSQFIHALAWKLASMLAGSIIKGERGAAEAERCMRMMMFEMAKASSQDANQSQNKPDDELPNLIRRRR